MALVGYMARWVSMVWQWTLPSFWWTPLRIVLVLRVHWIKGNMCKTLLALVNRLWHGTYCTTWVNDTTDLQSQFSNITSFQYDNLEDEQMIKIKWQKYSRINKKNKKWVMRGIFFIRKCCQANEKASKLVH